MNEAVVDWLNELSQAAAQQEFQKCCGAAWWCDQMVRARPFVDVAALQVAVDRAFDAMPQDAWLETFSSHPKIGDLNSLRMRLMGNKQWSTGEQAGVETGDEATLQSLATGNQNYEQRFGYVFIICATGLTAQEMLSQLESRLTNDEAAEFSIASAEQRKITHLRLGKLTPTDESNQENE